MSKSQDNLASEDDIAMEVDTVEESQDFEGSSRPATSIASDISAVEDAPSDEDDDKEQVERPASLPEPGTPLTGSYTWISPRPTAEGPYAVGVDEAGRGPALGPLVYGMAFCPVSFIDKQLAKMGFDDSKILKHDTRIGLLQALSADPVNLGWAVNVISPQAISSGMLAKPSINLNTQSQAATISLLKALLAPPYSLPINEVYVDALGPAEKYQEYLQTRFPRLQITVRNKADSIYKIVGAASVAAKVTRDFLVEDWVWEEAVRSGLADGGEATWGRGSGLGSGYPSDPNTKEWISSHLDKTFGYPTIARFSWAPIKLAMETKGHSVQWVDDGQKTLMKAFEGVTGVDKGRCSLTKELGISSVSSL